MKKITTLVWPIVILAMLLLAFNLLIQTNEAVGEASIVGNTESSTEQVGPPWFDEAWHFRQPVTISTDVSLSDYQVLIKLDNSNFDFSQAKLDGSDLLFTANDGTTVRSYWIESWNKASQLAFIWVKVPSLEIGDTTIYLYYSNAAATSGSDGSTTFNFFDDNWSQFTSGAKCATGEPWDCLDGEPAVSGGSLVLINNTGISTHDIYQYKAVGYRANFGLGDGHEWGGFINGAGGPRTMIRDLPTPVYDVHDLYLQDYVPTTYENNLLERVGVNDWHNAYHIYEISWREGQSNGDIDHGTSHVDSMIPSQVPTGSLPITFYSYFGSNATLLVDWVYVREYHYPEPTATVEAKQGLVDLEMIQVDAPDPLYAGEALTYTLTISNTSNIDAPGVILTDTLPGEVNFASVVPSQGSCNSEVVCNLGTIPANSTASITVVVTTTIDGVVTNAAIVGSLAYDRNINNNTYQELTTVLPSADLAIDLHGYPESVLPGGILTYIITVTNQGPSVAEIVGVVDRLPNGVEYQNSSPNICSVNVRIVTCLLGTPLNPSVDMEIHIIGKAPVSTTINLDSTATVSSTTHDPNPTNNTILEETLLDATKPVVNWDSPVHNEETYLITDFRSLIPLIASVTENDQIDRVEFKLWDHLWDNYEGHYVDIGTATTYPYQVKFDSDVLKSGEIYQMFVKAFDRAGNESDRKRILIVRYIIFMPLIDK